MAARKSNVAEVPELTVANENENDLKVHHMVRSLGQTIMPSLGIFDANTLDRHVQTWLDAGYKLYTATVTRSYSVQPSNTPVIEILYIFQKD